MTFEYITAEDAMARDGLRMVVVGNVPSPWGEAAKGIFHIKGLDWAAVRLVYDDPDLKKWAGGLSGPIAIYDNEKPRSGWSEILQLAERLSREPRLIPENTESRALMFGMAHEICAQGGLGWTRRLQSIHSGLRGEGGFPKPVAEYLSKKYGYVNSETDVHTPRVVALLDMLSARLKNSNTDYYLGQLSAVDVYSACFVALFSPLPEDVCDMNPHTRRAFESQNDATQKALDPVLLKHRDMMYERHLELPLSL